MSKPGAAANTLSSKLQKLDLREDWDFALHLPIRYEDETRLTRVKDAQPGVPCQVEAEIVHAEITYRPRRQLVVQAMDGSDTIYMRFLNFYGSQIKQLAVHQGLVIELHEGTRALMQGIRCANALGQFPAT